MTWKSVTGRMLALTTSNGTEASFPRLPAICSLGFEGLRRSLFARETHPRPQSSSSSPSSCLASSARQQRPRLRIVRSQSNHPRLGEEHDWFIFYECDAGIGWRATNGLWQQWMSHAERARGGGGRRRVRRAGFFQTPRSSLNSCLPVRSPPTRALPTRSTAKALYCARLPADFYLPFSLADDWTDWPTMRAIRFPPTARLFTRQGAKKGERPRQVWNAGRRRGKFPRCYRRRNLSHFSRQSQSPNESLQRRRPSPKTSSRLQA